jgi:hypothetical protein
VIDSVEGLSVPRDDSLGRSTTKSSIGDDSMRARQKPDYATPKQPTHLLALCVTLIQFDHLATLVFQQRGQQSALRKGRSGSSNELVFVFHKRL